MTVCAGVRFLRNGAHSLIARVCQHVVPPQPPQLFSIRVLGSPPQPPRGGVSCSLLPLEILHKMTTFPFKAPLRWIVGLCVLAACACAGRSTRSKGFQQTIRPSHTVTAEKAAKGSRASGQQGSKRAGQGRGRFLESAPPSESLVSFSPA